MDILSYSAFGVFSIKGDLKHADLHGRGNRKRLNMVDILILPRERPCAFRADAPGVPLLGFAGGEILPMPIRNRVNPLWRAHNSCESLRDRARQQKARELRKGRPRLHRHRTKDINPFENSNLWFPQERLDPKRCHPFDSSERMPGEPGG
jgi:hypothetical protein